MNLPKKPVLIGAAVGVAALAYFLTSSKSAHAAQGPTPQPLPSPEPQALPQSGPFDLPPLPQPASSPYDPGYQGPGTYRVLAPSGLNVRSGPGTSYPVVSHELRAGTDCELTGALSPAEWAPVTTPTGVSGFVCFNCVEAPGGPWLARIA